MTAEWWRKMKEDIEAGGQADIFPYRQNWRFTNRYG
jgi:isocitrate dehydrogenase kinase/phosphatase